MGVDEEDIYNAASLLLTDATHYEKMAKAVNPYGDGNASKSIVQAILHNFGLGIGQKSLGRIKDEKTI